MATHTPVSPFPARTIEDNVVSTITFRLVPFLFLLYIVAYLDRINVGFAVLQMQDQLKFSDAVYGNAAGMFFLGYFLFQLPSNLILEKMGAKRWIAILMVVWGIISCCMLLVRTPRQFYTMRFLLGLAEAGFFPGMILYLKSWFPAKARARAVAWFMTAGALSGVVGGLLSGFLLDHPHAGLSGWQWMFLMEGLPAIVLGGVVTIYLTNTPEEADWLMPEHKIWLISNLEQERNPVSAAGTEPNPSGWVLAGNVALLTVVYFGLNTCSYGMSLWLPKLIHTVSHSSNALTGVLASIPYLAAAIAMVLVGYHSDRTGERRWHTGLSALIAAAALLAGAYSTSIQPTLLFLSIAVLAQWSMLGPFWAMPTSLLRGTAAAAGVAIINSFGNLGGYFGPFIIGSVRTSTGGYKGGLLVVAATLGLGGLTALLVRLPKKVELPSPTQ
jgi:ACS family tartrate transporter-like MFS transporter